MIIRTITSWDQTCRSVGINPTLHIEKSKNQNWYIDRNERGQPVEITGPEGTTAFAYDDERLPDRPTTDAVGATQQPDGTHWHHHYDPQGRLVELEGPQGFRQQFFFDAHGRPVQRIEADGSHQSTAYDDIGRLNELTLGNGAVYRFAFDTMDRLDRPGWPRTAIPLR